MHTHTDTHKSIPPIRPATQHLFPFTNAHFIGIDEAGRGCLAGPVVSAAVWLPNPIPHILHVLDDSKKLTANNRERLATLIRKHALAFGIGFSWAPEIDRINILNATFISMSRACMALYSQQKRLAQTQKEILPQAQKEILPQAQKEIAYTQQSEPGHQKESSPTLQKKPIYKQALALPLAIDGNHCISSPYWASPLPIPAQIACIDGDAYIPAISAASILAKTVRDSLMLKFAQRYPLYHFETHKGYATEKHIQAIKTHGPCALHRLTFKKVRPELEQAQLFSS